MHHIGCIDARLSNRLSIPFCAEVTLQVLVSICMFHFEVREETGGAGGGDGSEAKRKKQKDFLVPNPKKNSPGQMAQSPRAGTGDSVGRFCRYECSTLFNYDSNLSMYGIFLRILFPPLDNRGLLPTPKRDVRFEFECSYFSIGFGYFAPEQRLFVRKTCTISVRVHPLGRSRYPKKKGTKTKTKSLTSVDRT